MIGGEALTLIDRLMAGGGESGAIRIDVNPSGHGGTIDLHVDARALPGQAGGGAAVGGQLSESVPQPTINRWSEEEKLVVGNASTSRVSNLVNLVINTLLPEARRRMEADRKKQEDERIEIEKKAKAAAEEKARKEAEDQAKKDAEEEERKRQAEAAAAAEADSAPQAVAEAMDVDSGAVMSDHGSSDSGKIPALTLLYSVQELLSRFSQWKVQVPLTLQNPPCPPPQESPS
jgi:E3 ubiquitin-protein ligase HUWE1